jgi:cytochrome c biogenesis protein CcmG/thiol:disulfide interchange protein DsbE
MELLRENVAHIAAWLPAVFVCLALASGLGLWLLGRNRSMSGTPSHMRRMTRAIVRFFLPLPIIGLIVAYGPMSPLFRTARRLQAQVGNTVPDTAFLRVSDGTEQRLIDFNGKVILVNLWATWCPPCIQELPTLNHLQVEYEKKGLVVVTLSDQPREQIVAFLERHAPRTTNGYMLSFGWLAIKDFRPFTLLIDRHGVLRDYFFGAQDYVAFEQKVKQYL